MAKEIPATVLTEDFVSPIGHLAIWFTVLENEMAGVLHFFLHGRADPTNIVLSQIQSTGGRIRLLTALANDYLTDEMWRTEFAHIIRELESTNADRNSIIHGPWYYYSPQDGTAGKLRTKVERGFLKHNLRPWSPKTILNTAESCILLAGRLQEFGFRLRDW